MEEIKNLGLYLLFHDLFNEDTKVKGFAELMLITDKENWEKSWAQQIYDSSTKIQKLTKLARGYTQLKEEPHPIKVSAEFREAINFYPELEDKITFIINNHCEGLRVKAHPGILSHIFYNLINNSTKYGNKISKISLTCKKEKGLIIYRDDGIGVPPAKKKKIFEKGYSEGTSSGLGLYLTKKICEAYGWEIKEGGIYGEGLELTFSTYDHQ